MKRSAGNGATSGASDTISGGSGRSESPFARALDTGLMRPGVIEDVP
jgi:hypothetical protein